MRPTHGSNANSDRVNSFFLQQRRGANTGSKESLCSDLGAIDSCSHSVVSLPLGVSEMGCFFTPRRARCGQWCLFAGGALPVALGDFGPVERTAREGNLCAQLMGTQIVHPPPRSVVDFGRTAPKSDQSGRRQWRNIDSRLGEGSQRRSWVAADGRRAAWTLHQDRLISSAIPSTGRPCLWSHRI